MAFNQVIGLDGDIIWQDNITRSYPGSDAALPYQNTFHSPLSEYVPTSSGGGGDGGTVGYPLE